MTYAITESEKRNILSLHGMGPRPLQVLNECKITTDGKYILFEDNFYSTETGELMPLTEKWTISDTLHTIGDVVSMGLDFVIPGSGAIIDAVNAISYLIEAQFMRDPKKKKTLYIMGAITAGFVILPGPLQAFAIPLKRAIKTGKMVKNAKVAKGISVVYKNIGKILMALPNLIKRVLDSPLGVKMLGKFGKYLSTQLDSIVKGIKASFDEFASKVSTKGVKGAAKSTVRSTLTRLARKKMGKFFGSTAKVVNGTKVLRKAGFSVGRTYRYMGPKGMTTIVIKKITDDAVVMSGKNFPQAAVSIKKFVDQAIGAPWLRRGKSVYVPFFVKRFSNMILPDGSNLDYAAIEEMADLDPDQTSMESLGWLRDDLASYEGDQGQYSINPTVQAFQNALLKLGYALPKAGADGKYGPETQIALKQFQLDSKLETSSGKMDRLTAQQLALELQDKGVVGSEDLQKTLTSI